MFSRESKLFSVDALQVERWCLMEVSKKSTDRTKWIKSKIKKMEREKRSSGQVLSS